MKKKIRRKTLKIATAPQIRLFEEMVDEAGAEREVARARDIRFIDLDPRDIVLGGRRLDEYLKEAKERRAPIVRDVVRAPDYSGIEGSYSSEGRPPYSPAAMVGLILYGLIHGVSSLRGLERLARMDLGCMWVCGGITPDHSSIGRFIALHAEQLRGELFEAMTAETLRRLGRGVQETALDGTVVQAVASAHHTLKLEATRAMLQEAREAQACEPDNSKALEKVLQAEKAVQVAEERAAARKKYGRDAEQTRVSPTEPESVYQPLKFGASKPSYKPIILATPDRVIVGQTVEASCETKPVAELLDQANRIGAQAVAPPVNVSASEGEPSAAAETESVALTKSDEGAEPGKGEGADVQQQDQPPSQVPPGPQVRAVLADAGFFTEDVIKCMDQRDIEFLCPQGSAKGDKSWDKTSKKHFAKAQFVYDPKLDVFCCPAGEQLTPSKRCDGPSEPRPYTVYSARACAGCSMRPQCTTSKKGRSIKRYDWDGRKDQIRDRMKLPEDRLRYRKRSAWVEPVFSLLKQVQRLVRFTRRGLAGVRLEFALHAMAHNLRRILALTEPRDGLATPLTTFISGLIAALFDLERLTCVTPLRPSTKHHLWLCA
jgi:transposase